MPSTVQTIAEYFEIKKKIIQRTKNLISNFYANKKLTNFMVLKIASVQKWFQKENDVYKQPVKHLCA